MRHERNGKSGIAETHKAEGDKHHNRETNRDVGIDAFDEPLEECFIFHIAGAVCKLGFVGLFLQPDRVEH